MIRLVLNLVRQHLNLVRQNLNNFRIDLDSIRLHLHTSPTVGRFLLTTNTNLNISRLHTGPHRVAFNNTRLILLVNQIRNNRRHTLLRFNTSVSLATNSPPQGTRASVTFMAHLGTPNRPPRIFLVRHFSFGQRSQTRQLQQHLFFQTHNRRRTNERRRRTLR